jgi:fucose 4-O-acetylase-like acetyltransferase
LNAIFFGAGAALAVLAYAASFLPTPYARSDFWTSSPCFFFIRLGVMTLAIAVAYGWEAVRGDARRWSPMQQLGRTSLFIYWIHVEMVYGLVSLPLHKAFSLGGAWTALAVFSIFMLGCSIGKDRFVGWWRTRRSGPPAAAYASR